MAKKISLCSFILLVLYVVVPRHALAQTKKDNAELQQMADDDQRSRANGVINWGALNQQDSLRRVRIFELIKDHKLQTAKDYLNAGIVFQHGNDSIASDMAVKSFKTALALDSTLNRWWYAAAVDRDLMRRNLPQVYGTQFLQINGKWLRYKIDTTKVTDKQRSYYNVETLAEQIQKERLMNLKPIGTYHAETQSIEETIAEIKEQYKNGTLSAYNVSEESINTFGYELMGKYKYNEAVKIFKLNTQLYSQSANTFDSYGEALMKANRKNEGIKAYQKSIKLDPENEHAKQILKENKPNHLHFSLQLW